MIQKFDFVVTIQATSYMEVEATDREHARQIAERRLPTEFGQGVGRTVEIIDIEEATP